MRLARAPGGLSMTATVVLVAAAHAEVDTDFAKQSHTDGIDEQCDDNAGITSITAILAATLLPATTAADVTESGVHASKQAVEPERMDPGAATSGADGGGLFGVGRSDEISRQSLVAPGSGGCEHVPARPTMTLTSQRRAAGHSRIDFAREPWTNY